MSDKDPIKDLFRDKLQSHEVMPSKAVWSNVSSSLGHSAASASSIGASSILKIAAVVVGVSTVGVVSYLYMNSEDSNTKANKKIVLQDEILDEPTSALDDYSCDIVIDLLKDLSQENNSVLIIVTHDKRLKDKFKKFIDLDAS